jgi:uncharacterized protein involved in cysteine biosynthesis
MILLAAPARAIAQLDDPALLGVILRSVVWSVLALAGLAVAASWGLADLAAGHGHLWLSWLAGLAGGALAALAAVYLFLPLAAVIATLFAPRVIAAVERRYYPFLPPGRAAPLGDQVWDGIALGLRVLLWQLLALVLAVLLPGLGLALGWAVAAWSLGRGLFVTVAMTRMDRAQAVALYRTERGTVWAQGALMAAAGLVPPLNLLAPVLGVAALVHVLHANNPAVSPAFRAGGAADR